MAIAFNQRLLTTPSNEFKNASAHGVPLQIYRPVHKACQDFQQIAEDLAALIQKKE